MFALQAFGEGAVVEACPVVVFDTPADSLPEVLDRWMFDWGVLAGVPNTAALALGFGSLYNDDNPANMRYEARPTEAALRFIAVRDIEADEELTINYSAGGGGATWHDDNWFERKNMHPLRSSPGRAASSGAGNTEWAPWERSPQRL